jgi:hypothetical protein
VNASAPSNSESRSSRPEPWAWLAFGLGACTLGLLFYLGWKPGGRLPVLAYLWGPFVIGCASAVVLFFALVWSLWRRPVVQRRRMLPLGVVGASLWLCSLPIAYPSSHEGKASPTRFTLPFLGEARVEFGGDQRSRLRFDPSRRFGLGFAPSAGSLQVVAPAEAEVVGRRAGLGGDQLVLAVREREYLVLEGIDPVSCELDPGERCSAGAGIGTASTLLFVHLQDGAEVGRCEGIPMRFWNYSVDGRAVEAGSPTPPQVVAPLAPGARAGER